MLYAELQVPEYCVYSINIRQPALVHCPEYPIFIAFHRVNNTWRKMDEFEAA